MTNFYLNTIIKANYYYIVKINQPLLIRSTVDSCKANHAT